MKASEKKRTGRGLSQVLLIGIILALGLLGLGRRCSLSRSTLANDYVKPGKDTIAVAIEMSPLTYTMHNDTAEGFDYSILRALAARHNFDVVFHPVSDLHGAFCGLRNGKYDLVVAAFPATTALKEHFRLTDAVYLDRQVLVQRRLADGSIAKATQQDLRGDTVWITHGAPLRTRLANMAAEMGDTVTVKSTPDLSAEHLVIMTALGDIPRAIVSERIAAHIAPDYPQLDISVPVTFNQFQVWAAAPGDSALTDSLNVWLKEFRGTAAYDSLCAKYLR